jgi:hypothetical protein
MRVATFLMVASGLVGCQTGQQYQADVNASLHARLSAYDGTTMAGFTARTGLLPTTTILSGPTGCLSFEATQSM